MALDYPIDNVTVGASGFVKFSDGTIEYHQVGYMPLKYKLSDGNIQHQVALALAREVQRLRLDIVHSTRRPHPSLAVTEELSRHQEALNKLEQRAKDLEDKVNDMGDKLNYHNL